jgi:hypothetical protein
MAAGLAAAFPEGDFARWATTGQTSSKRLRLSWTQSFSGKDRSTLSVDLDGVSASSSEENMMRRTDRVSALA